MPIIGKALMPFFAPGGGGDLYLIKNGIVQSGFTFTGAGKRYDTSSTVTPSITYQTTGGGRIAALSSTTSTRKGSKYSSNSIANIIQDYSELHIKCLRYLRGNSNAKITIGTYVEAGSTSYAPSNFKQSIAKTTSDDSSAVQLDISLSSASFVSDVCVCFAWSVPANGSNYGVYIYDVWLSR